MSEWMRLVSRASPREVTRYLSRHPGTDVNAADQHGAIPLVISASGLNEPMVRCLLDAHADPNVRQMDAPGGQTALYAAADGQAIHLGDGWSDMTYSGLEPHPQIDEELSGYESIARMLLDAGADPSMGPATGTSPLWIAAQNGNAHVLRLLLRDGRDNPERARLGDRATPLYAAARNGHTAAVKELLRDPRVGVDTRIDSLGMPPLWIAVLNDFDDVAELLLARGADALAPLDAPSRLPGQPRFYHGRTLLHAVCISGLRGFRPPWKAPAPAGNALGVLLPHLRRVGGERADWLERPDTLDVTPLALAIACANVNIAACLLAMGADASHPSIDSALVSYGENVRFGEDPNKTAALGVLSVHLGLSESGLIDANEDEDDVTTRDPGRSGEPPRNELTAMVESARGKCGYCGAQPRSGPALSRCSRCKLLRYCGRECATAHWKAAQFPHRLMCGRLHRAIESLPTVCVAAQHPQAQRARPAAPSPLPPRDVQIVIRDPTSGGDIVATYLY